MKFFCQLLLFADVINVIFCVYHHMYMHGEGSICIEQSSFFVNICEKIWNTFNWKMIPRQQYCYMCVQGRWQMYMYINQSKIHLSLKEGEYFCHIILCVYVFLWSVTIQYILYFMCFYFMQWKWKKCLSLIIFSRKMYTIFVNHRRWFVMGYFFMSTV